MISKNYSRDQVTKITLVNFGCVGCASITWGVCKEKKELDVKAGVAQ